MRRYIRSNIAGATYFFTLTLEDRSASHLTDHADDLRAAVRYVKDRRPFVIDAMVLLPDHLHAIWTLPPDDADFATRWMLIKQRFTKSAGVATDSRGIKGERALWQRRYWEHLVRDDDDFARHVDYVHFNPVKHGLVQRAKDWTHSSFHRYVKEGKLPADWGVAMGVRGAFGE